MTFNIGILNIYLHLFHKSVVESSHENYPNNSLRKRDNKTESPWERPPVSLLPTPTRGETQTKGNPPSELKTGVQSNENLIQGKYVIIRRFSFIIAVRRSEISFFYFTFLLSVMTSYIM